MDQIMEVVGAVNSVVLGFGTLCGLLAAGLLFSVWTKFSQYRILTHGVSVVRGGYDHEGDPGAISHFQALAAALSATIGLGNIGGVALAIALGGPGAVVWMWIVGFLGMALKSVEITLAMMYRNTADPDDPHGGAMWVVERTLGAKGGGYKVLARTIGSLFCVTLIIMTIAGGNMFQTWNVSDLTLYYFGVPKFITGSALAIAVGMVIVGGIKRIGHVAAALVPFMCVLYLLAAFAVLMTNMADIPAMFALILTSAFGETEAAGAFLGGSMGLAFQTGMKRALFSNEAGLGSAPIAHAAAKTNEPAREGVVGGLGPFIDTLCICTLTALVILVTGTWNRAAIGEMEGGVQLVEQADGARTLEAPQAVEALPALPHGETWSEGSRIFLIVQVNDAETGSAQRSRIFGTVRNTGEALSIEWEAPPPHAEWVRGPSGEAQTGVYRDFTGATLTGHAFDRAFPRLGLGKWLVTIAAWLFSISTMISWSYYGEQGIIYMAGKRGVLPYKIFFLAMAVVGSVIVSTDKQLGDLADFGVSWMLIVNMGIVLCLGFLAVRKLDDYFRRLDLGEFRSKE